MTKGLIMKSELKKIDLGKLEVHVPLAWFTVTVMLAIVLGILALNFGEAQAAKKCDVRGLNWKGSHPTLKVGLCRLSRELGTVVVTNTKRHKNCRTRSDRTGRRNSWHKYFKGCRAADIRVRGASPNRVKRWWLNYTRKKSYVGAAAVYGSGFIHVDTRTHGARSW